MFFIEHQTFYRVTLVLLCDISFTENQVSLNKVCFIQQHNFLSSCTFYCRTHVSFGFYIFIESYYSTFRNRDDYFEVNMCQQKQYFPQAPSHMKDIRQNKCF